MKTAAKVFIIIGMITGFYLILPIIFGAIALSKLNKNQLTTGWKVVVLIFVSVIGGILLLCLPKEEEAPAAAPAVETTSAN